MCPFATAEGTWVDRMSAVTESVVAPAATWSVLETTVAVYQEWADLHILLIYVDVEAYRGTTSHVL